MLTERASGILLHPTALPGDGGIGDLGDGAVAFIDFLEAAGQTVWQVLPLGPTGYGDSPYSAFSAFAGNLLLISPERLVECGDLLADDLAPPPQRPGSVDFGAVRTYKTALLHRAAQRFALNATDARRAAFVAFREREAGWLDDYALYCAIRLREGQRPWSAWPAALRDRDPVALQAIRNDLSEAIAVETYTQFVFDEQWRTLKTYAAERGVRIFGDLPIFVAGDSADVWAHRSLFQLDEQGRPLRVAGVPPDYFSATGQRWGNPLYAWERHRADGFAWWLDRLRRNLDLYDLIRIDHFRGFAACWSIPAHERTAIHGVWEDVPGDELFTAATDAFGPLPVVAEDLGIITPDVEALRDRFGFPGMKILHFAFGDGPGNPYLPHNFTRNSVVYTGTHDNDTTAGWWQSLSREERASVERYLGRRVTHPVHEMMRLAAASASRLCILPMQDLLGLGPETRFNRPGEADGNWQWRLVDGGYCQAAQPFLKELTAIYGR